MTTVPADSGRAGRLVRRWPLLLVGLGWLAVSVWLLLTDWTVIWTGHPAYPVTLCAVGTAGAALVAASQRHRHPPRRRLRRLRRVRRRRRWETVRRMAALAGAGALVAALIWLQPLTATAPAVAAMSAAQPPRVSTTATTITIQPAGRPVTGLVFQPGARVDPRAYVPLLRQISRDGVLVVIVKQPYDIAFLAINAPSPIIAAHPHIQHWAVGGHSLGGVAAASYAGSHPHQVRGLLLWASYPAHSLAAQPGLHVASISGSNDTLATPADITASRARLPASTTFTQIHGGIHAYFGDYGPQPGDGRPSTTRSQAQQHIVAASLTLLDSLPQPP